MPHAMPQKLPDSENEETARSVTVPNVDSEGVWHLSLEDVDLLAEGCSVLGCGGGGNTLQAKLRLRELLKTGKDACIIAPKALEDGDFVVPVGFMGAPTVLTEIVGSGKEFNTAVDKMAEISDRIPDAVMSIEMGGTNGTEPLCCAVMTDLPCVDADGMGRAFPEVVQYLPMHPPENRCGQLVMAGIRSQPTVFQNDDLKQLHGMMVSHLLENHSAIAAVATPLLNKRVCCLINVPGRGCVRRENHSDSFLTRMHPIARTNKLMLSTSTTLMHLALSSACQSGTYVALPNSCKPLP